jgi:sugar phosphate isomerase/epimerase
MSGGVHFQTRRNLPVAGPAGQWQPGGNSLVRSGRSPRVCSSLRQRRVEVVPLVRKGIATVSVSGVLTEKLDAVAAAGFDSVEIFDNDLIASPLSPRDIAARCADLGLGIDLYQPVRDVEGVPWERFPAVLHRLRTKFAVAAELGAPCVLVCSQVGEDAPADPDLTAEQLHRAGELAADHGVTIAFEALAWGRHIDRVGQAWDAVRRAGHPAVTLAVDTFHMLARGDGAAALAGVPGERIGFVQVADAPLLDMNLLEWSRHHRCFPGQGTLDVADVVAAVLRAGYRGPLSIEVFSDVVRETDPFVTARDAMRSLVFLEDQLATTTTGDGPALVAAPPPARSADFGFVEIACEQPALRARLRRVRPASQQAGDLVAERRRARRGERGRPADDGARRGVRGGRAAGRGGGGARGGDAVAGGGDDPKGRRGRPAGDHVAVGCPRLRQRRGRRAGRLAARLHAAVLVVGAVLRAAR